jgi:hypothetical protein
MPVPVPPRGGTGVVPRGHWLMGRLMAGSWLAMMPV